MQKAAIFSKQKLEEMFLGENRESKNINLARKYLVSKGLDNERAQDVLDRIRHDISNARLADSKFLLGLARMTLNGQLEDSKSIFGINKTLKFVANPAHVNEYNNDLNGMAADELIGQFSTAIQQDNAEDMEKLSKNQYVENKSYQIVRIPDFKTASRYSEYTEWCVTQDKSSYSTYTDDMEGVFYFCLRNGWKDEERKPGKNTPFDDYGLSMVAVSVYSDGSLKTCTTRWNHGDKELGVKANDQSMNTSQISQLVGRNFYQTFLPRTKEEIASIKKKQDEPYIKALNVIKSSPDAYYDFYISLPLVGNYQAVIIGREDNYRVLYNDGPNSFYLTDNEGYIKSFSNVNSFAQKYIVWRKDTNMEVFEVASSQVVFSMKNVSYFSAIRNVLEVEKTDDTVILLSSDLKVIEPIENLKKIRWEGREYFTLIDGSNNRFLFDGKNLKLVTNESFVVVTGLGQKLLCCFNRDGEQFKVFNVHKGLLSDWFYNNPKQRSKLYYNEDYYFMYRFITVWDKSGMAGIVDVNTMKFITDGYPYYKIDVFGGWIIRCYDKEDNLVDTLRLYDIAKEIDGNLKQQSESIIREWEDDSFEHEYYDYLNEYDENYVFQQFLDSPKGSKQDWGVLINPNMYQRALQEFTKFGHFEKFPSQYVYQWMGIIMKNTAILVANTNIAGHGNSYPYDAISETLLPNLGERNGKTYDLHDESVWCLSSPKELISDLSSMDLYDEDRAKVEKLEKLITEAIGGGIHNYGGLKGQRDLFMNQHQVNDYDNQRKKLDMKEKFKGVIELCNIFNKNNEWVQYKGKPFEYDYAIDDDGSVWKTMEIGDFLDWVGIIDWMVMPDGSDAWSDFGLEPLENIFSEYNDNLEPEKVLVLVNKALDVYHARGDMSSIFITGGKYTLNKISNGLPLEKKKEMKTLILKESQLALIEAKASLEDIYNKYYKDVPLNDFQQLIAADPTAKPNEMGKFGKWILNLYKKGKLKVGDIPELKDSLSYFIKFYNRIEKKDINQYQSVAELYNTVAPFMRNPEQATSKSDIARKAKEEGTEKFYEDGRWEVIIPKTEKAACLYGKGTKWCTAAESSSNMFEYYNDAGNLYINIDKQSNRKYQFHFEKSQFMDERDEPIKTPICNTIGLTPALVKKYCSVYGLEGYYYLTSEENTRVISEMTIESVDGQDNLYVSSYYEDNDTNSTLSYFNPETLEKKDLYNSPYQQIGSLPIYGEYLPIRNGSEILNLLSIEDYTLLLPEDSYNIGAALNYVRDKYNFPIISYANENGTYLYDLRNHEEICHFSEYDDVKCLSFSYYFFILNNVITEYDEYDWFIVSVEEKRIYNTLTKEFINDTSFKSVVKDNKANPILVFEDGTRMFLTLDGKLEPVGNPKGPNNGKRLESRGDKKGKLLTENRESKNINLARRYLMSKGLSQNQAQKVLDGIRHDMSNARLVDCKFLLGLSRMAVDGQLSDAKQILGMNRTLKLIADPTHVNDYNNDLNGLNADELIEQFATIIHQNNDDDRKKISKEQYTENKSYQIVKIPDFETASQYGKYTEWCVTHGESAFDSYTDEGLGVFYFCLRDGWQNEERKPGKNAPFDDYGLSMVAVSVHTDGSLNTCTTRWNHGDKELDVKANDQSMDTTQISRLIGRNFYQTFLPLSKEDIDERVYQPAEKVLKKQGEELKLYMEKSEDYKNNPQLVLSIPYKNNYLLFNTITKDGIRDEDGNLLIVDYKWHCYDNNVVGMDVMKGKVFNINLVNNSVVNNDSFSKDDWETATMAINNILFIIKDDSSKNKALDLNTFHPLNIDLSDINGYKKINDKVAIFYLKNLQGRRVVWNGFINDFALNRTIFSSVDTISGYYNTVLQFKTKYNFPFVSVFIDDKSEINGERILDLKNNRLLNDKTYFEINDGSGVFLICRNLDDYLVLVNKNTGNESIEFIRIEMSNREGTIKFVDKIGNVYYADTKTGIIERFDIEGFIGQLKRKVLKVFEYVIDNNVYPEKYGIKTSFLVDYFGRTINGYKVYIYQMGGTSIYGIFDEKNGDFLGNNLFTSINKVVVNDMVHVTDESKGQDCANLIDLKTGKYVSDKWFFNIGEPNYDKIRLANDSNGVLYRIYPDGKVELYKKRRDESLKIKKVILTNEQFNRLRTNYD